MKFLFDLLPVVLFFVAFKLADIYTATAVAIVTSALQVAWLKLRRQDETFIKWKPTVLYWLFGAVLLGSALLKRNLIRSVLSQEMQLPDAVWTRLNLAWVVFFAFMGAANLYVAFNYPTDQWVNFKLFGGMGLMLLFVVAQALVLARYVEEAVKPA